MATASDTVGSRIERARPQLTPAKVGAALALIAALGFALVFAQDPLVHDAMHNFRHVGGIACH